LAPRPYSRYRPKDYLRQWRLLVTHLIWISSRV
jgi:hypothetical protein